MRYCFFDPEQQRGHAHENCYTRYSGAYWVPVPKIVQNGLRQIGSVR